MDSLLDSVDLLRLPLRAIAAYSARCARRVQPVYVGNGSVRAELLKPLDRAIQLAEDFAFGRMVETFDERCTIFDEAGEAMVSIEDLSPDFPRNAPAHAASAAHCAALSTHALACSYELPRHGYGPSIPVEVVAKCSDAFLVAHAEWSARDAIKTIRIINSDDESLALRATLEDYTVADPVLPAV